MIFGPNVFDCDLSHPCCRKQRVKGYDAMIDKKMSYVITFGFDNRSELYTNTITLHIFIHFVVPSF